jgi:hypothetical protein
MPVLLDKDNVIIAGHGTTRSAVELEMADIPTVQVDRPTPVQIRTYVIAASSPRTRAGTVSCWRWNSRSCRSAST